MQASLSLPAPPIAGVDLASAQMREFHGILAQACETVRGVAEDEAQAAAQTLSHELVQLIELQAMQSRRAGGRFAAQTEPQASFLKAALADELLLNLDWAGRLHWRHLLLEARMFRSSLAGEKVFADIEQILSLREPAQRPLARLYLWVLSLGFQGRWRGGELERIAQLRRELFQFVYQRPAGLDGEDRRLAQTPYASTWSHLRARALPRLSRWWLVFALGLLALLALSELVWLWQSWPLRQVLS